MAIMGCGATVHEALRAADTLEAEGIEARVIDLYSIKPLDAPTIQSLRMPIVTVEDHAPEGGVGEAVLSALAHVQPRPILVQLAVRNIPHSEQARRADARSPNRCRCDRRRSTRAHHPLNEERRLGN